MSTQYRLKEDWKPVGGSKIAKKLADWMNSVAKQLNRAEVVSGGTARPTELGFRIEVDGLGNDDMPFWLTYVTTAIRVRQGTVQRNGTSVTLAPDSGEEYKSITALVGGAFGASATYIVYGILDKGLVPTTLTVAAAAALPADTQKNLYFQIGTATTNSSSEINGVVQTWWGGNRDDVAYIFDAESPNIASKNYSLQASPNAGHVGEGQLYGWIGATSTNPDWNNGAFLTYREVTTDVDGTHFTLKYCGINEALYVSEADWALILAQNSNAFGNSINTYIGTSGSYWKQGETALATCYADKIGKTASIKVIDLKEYQLVSGTSSPGYKISVDWDARIAYQEDGTTPVLNYNSANWHLNFTADDAWSASGLKIGNATAASSTTAGSIYSKGGLNLAKNLIVQDATPASLGAGAITTAGGISAEKGGYFLQGNGGQAGYFYDNSNNEIFIGNGFAINIAKGDYYHGGSQGATQTASKVRLPLANGGIWEGYIRGGILTDA